MANAGRPISAVLHDIAGNLQEIVRAELRLAKTEIAEELGKTRTAGVLCGIALVMIIFSALFSLLAVVYALSLVMPAWAAALIVAAGSGAIAALCLGLGIKRFKSMRAARKTAVSLKENAEWAKQVTS